jgi:hypothetical protein
VLKTWPGCDPGVFRSPGHDIDDLGAWERPCWPRSSIWPSTTVPFFDARPPKQPLWRPGTGHRNPLTTRPSKAFDFSGAMCAPAGSATKRPRRTGGAATASPPVRRSQRYDPTCMPCERFRTWRSARLRSSTSSHTGPPAHESATRRSSRYCGTHRHVEFRPAFEQAVRNGEDVFLKADGPVGWRRAPGGQVLARISTFTLAIPGGWPAR